MALCLWVFWPGLLAWFQQDDFAWLGLGLSIHDARTFLRSLFAPMAQGTIRPLSERAFFLTFHALFGMEALPFRIWVFLTQFAAMALLAAVSARLFGSRAAGFWAAAFWGVNSALSASLSWTSAYNQTLCAFFLLLALFWLIRYAETGLLRYNVLQWVTFLLGFGALELNIVYPVIALAYTVFFARRHIVGVLGLFVPSIGYFVLHNAVSPKPRTGVYALFFDSDVVSTLSTYLTWAPGALRPMFRPADQTWAITVNVLAGAGLLLFLFTMLRSRRWQAFFPIVWFMATIAPYLPLKLHVADYYLAVPVIGLSMLGGWAFASAWRSGWLFRPLAILLACLYLSATIPVSRAYAQWHLDRSAKVKRLFFAVEQARKLHPGKTILLTGVSSELFWAGFYDNPFRLRGIRDVYLVPGSENTIEPHPELGDVTDFVLPAVATGRALAAGTAVVYTVSQDKLRNITAVYTSMAPRTLARNLARRVDVAQPLLADQLGPSWHPIENGFRWMPRRATVRLGGPRLPGEQLLVEGFYPEEQLAKGPPTVTVRVDGQTLGQRSIEQPGTFEWQFPLPERLRDRESVEVEVEISRVFVPEGDGRELGAAFGVFAIR
jgi:hypothetical protein